MLNHRQSLFVSEYLKSGNATQAAIKAGYSPKGASTVGERLLRNVEIRKAIEEFKDQMRMENKVTAQRVLDELAAIAFQNPADYFDLTTGSTKLKPLSEIPKEKLAALQLTVQTSRSGPTVQMKFHDKLHALQALGEHLGLKTSLKDLIARLDEQQLEEVAKQILKISSDK